MWTSVRRIAAPFRIRSKGGADVRGRQPMNALFWNGNGIHTKLRCGAIAALGAVSLGIVALSRGEPVNAAWLVIAAVCIYFIAYRYYALFIANKVLGINSGRP